MTREETNARSQLKALAAQDQGPPAVATRASRDPDLRLRPDRWLLDQARRWRLGLCVSARLLAGSLGRCSTSTERADTEIKHFVDERDFQLVMSAIRALDSLGKRRFARRNGLHRGADEVAWRRAVEQLLLDALAHPLRSSQPESL